MSFDTEKFISEIEARKAIWDMSRTDYCDRDCKKKQWEEIVHLFGGEKLPEQEKRDLGLNLQKKWKNIRICYTREMRRLKNIKSGSAASCKTQYHIYNQLTFLKNISADTNTESSIPEEDSSNDQTILGPYSRDNIIGRRKKRKTNDENANDELINILQKSIDARTNREATIEKDEDRMFLLSLLSSFKKIPEYKKPATKIQIIEQIERAQNNPHHSSDFHLQPTTSHNNYYGMRDYNENDFYMHRPPSQHTVNLESSYSTETSCNNSDYVDLF